MRNSDYNGRIKLAALIIGLPLLIYMVSVKRTLKLNRTYSANKASLASAPVKESRENKQEVRVLDGNTIYSLSDLMGTHNVSALKYTPHRIATEEDKALIVGELQAEGRFIPLTLFLQDVEANDSIGNVCSADYKLHIDQATKKKSLRMTLLIEQIIRK